MTFCEWPKTTVEMSFYMSCLLFWCLGWSQSRMRQITEVYAIQFDLNLQQLLHFRSMNSFLLNAQFIKIKFINQDLDLLKIPSIFRDHRVTSKIFQYFENLDPPLICYQYRTTIRNIIFNYNQVTIDPDVPSSIQSTCSYADSPFLYPSAGHVVSDDLSCIPDTGLRSLFNKHTVSIADRSNTCPLPAPTNFKEA